MELRKRHGLRIAVAALLLALAATTALGTYAALHYYREALAIRLDPLQLELYAHAEPPVLAPGQRRVVIFGDSRSLMWTPPEGVPDVQWVNRGIGHQTTAQALARFDAEIPQLAPHVIVLQVGVNDLKAIPLFPEREREIVARAQSNLDALVTRARSVAREVILVTIFPIGPVALWRTPFWSDRVQLAVDQINTHLATLEAPGVRLLAADTILLDAQRELRPAYALDHLHLAPAAYRTINSQGLVPMLRAH